MSNPTQTVSTSSLMQEGRTFPPCPEVIKRAYINAEQYKKMYDRSINDPDGFWLEQAATLDWFKKPTLGRKFVWDTERKRIEHTWFEDGQLNVSANCLDRHLKARGNKPAIVWQGEPENNVVTLTYAQLHKEVCKFANVLKSLGIKKGDRVLDLPADDPRTARCDAGLHADWRDPLDSLRRIQRGCAGRTHQRFGVPAAHHLEHFAARWQEYPAQRHRR